MLRQWLWWWWFEGEGCCCRDGLRGEATPEGAVASPMYVMMTLVVAAVPSVYP